MPAKNLKLYEKCVSLRRKGKSYNNIHERLGISKSTISNWLSKIIWSVAIRDNLTKKVRSKNYKHIKFMSSRIALEAEKRHEKYRIEARDEYRSLKVIPLFITGLALYWGEGDKRNRSRVGLINSDPEMIVVIINFYRKVLKIPNEKIRAALFLYPDIELERALTYWSDILELPRENFIKTQILQGRSRRTRRKVSYGMCNLYLTSTELVIKIREWTRLLTMDMRE